MAAWRGCSCLTRTNGKAKRLIQNGLREQADHRLHGSSAERAWAIGPWTDSYNLAIPHGGAHGRPVIRRQKGDP